jgi:hypothetical protein
VISFPDRKCFKVLLQVSLFKKQCQRNIFDCL